MAQLSADRVVLTDERAEVRALACALAAEQGVSLSRWSGAELAIEAVKRGITRDDRRR